MCVSGRVRSFLTCALYKKTLDLLDEESISERAVIELVYKYDDKSYRK